MDTRKPRTQIEPAPDAPAIKASLPVVTSIKGFASDWTCRGFKFESGKTYTVEGQIKACENGFHACPTDEHPLSVFDYYPPAGARFAEVTQSGASDRDGNKLASASITIGVEISLGDLVARAVKWVWDRVDQSLVQTNTGHRSAATNTGDQSAATNTGHRSAATNTGHRSAATNTGYQSAASATGMNSVAMSIGVGARGMATETNAICLVCRDENTGKILAVRASKAGENGVRPGVWYSLNASGEFVEEVA